MILALIPTSPTIYRASSPRRRHHLHHHAANESLTEIDFRNILAAHSLTFIGSISSTTSSIGDLYFPPCHPVHLIHCQQPPKYPRSPIFGQFSRTHPFPCF